MTADEILKKYEDDNEYHFHQSNREWIMEAMEEYAKQQAWEKWKIGKRGDVSQWEFEEILFNQWWETTNDSRRIFQ